MAEAAEASLEAIRLAATCPACSRLYSEPRTLEPCRHSVCRGCLYDGLPRGVATATRVRCPVCRVPCTGDTPHRSMSTLVNLIALWPDDDTSLTASPQRRRFISIASVARSLNGSSSLRFRPSAVLHFPGPPHSLCRWPPQPGAAASGVAAILRDANNQRLWASVPAADGQQARPVFQPALDEEYTISGFCLARPDGDWLVVMSDFYRDCLVVCDIGGGCLQRLLRVPKPSALCADDTSSAVFAIAANGTEVRAFEWRRGRLRQREGAALRHPGLRYARAIAVGAGRVCVADSAAGCVFTIDRQRLLNGDGDRAVVGGFACGGSQPIAVAVAEFGGAGGGDGCAFVNSVGANQRNCVAVLDLASGRRLLELPCGFACTCGCPSCADTGVDADVGSLHFDPARLELVVARRVRANYALVFQFDDGDVDEQGGSSD